MDWVSRLTAIGLEMALPGAGGLWLDLKLGTSPLFLVIGVVLGFVAGLWQLLRITRTNKG
jgi:F0F1-type ATP synthase assembly protein I